MTFSIIVPAYNAANTLSRLLDSLEKQTCRDFEVIVINDASTDGTATIARGYDCTLINLADNRGPAYCRNLGAKRASGEILLFTDSDCQAHRNWVENIRRIFSATDTDAIMGRLVIPPSTFVGDCISALGFPAGGAIGFDKIWRVDRQGFTRSLSSCNCAVRNTVFWEAGGFDESFPYAGGEDSYLAYRMVENRRRIRYCPEVLVHHEARNSIRGFMKWHFRRGASSFIFSSKISGRQRYVALRLWSTGNIIRRYAVDKKFPLIMVLLGVSTLFQGIGYLSAKHNTIKQDKR